MLSPQVFSHVFQQTGELPLRRGLSGHSKGSSSVKGSSLAAAPECHRLREPTPQGQGAFPGTVPEVGTRLPLSRPCEELRSVTARSCFPGESPGSHVVTLVNSIEKSESKHVLEGVLS